MKGGAPKLGRPVFSCDTALCREGRLAAYVLRRAAVVHVLRLSSQIPSDNIRKMAAFDMTEDIIVLGGLAILFCWTYICLPLIFYS